MSPTATWNDPWSPALWPGLDDEAADATIAPLGTARRPADGHELKVRMDRPELLGETPACRKWEER
jgi:hypothetical protein